MIYGDIWRITRATPFTNTGTLTNPPRTDEFAIGIELSDLVAYRILDVHKTFGVNCNTLITQTITRVCGSAILTIARTQAGTIPGAPLAKKLSIRIKLLNPFVPTVTRRHMRGTVGRPIHHIHNATRGISRKGRRSRNNESQSQNQAQQKREGMLCFSHSKATASVK